MIESNQGQLIFLIEFRLNAFRQIPEIIKVSLDFFFLLCILLVVTIFKHRRNNFFRLLIFFFQFAIYIFIFINLVENFFRRTQDFIDKYGIMVSHRNAHFLTIIKCQFNLYKLHNPISDIISAKVCISSYIIGGNAQVFNIIYPFSTDTARCNIRCSATTVNNHQIGVFKFLLAPDVIANRFIDYGNAFI